LGTKTLTRGHVKGRTSTCKVHNNSDRGKGVQVVRALPRSQKFRSHEHLMLRRTLIQLTAVLSLPPQLLLKPGANCPFTDHASFDSLRPCGKCRSPPHRHVPQHCLEGTLSRMFPRRTAQRRQDDSHIPSGRPRVRRLRQS
jgi:hypothetical protein